MGQCLLTTPRLEIHTVTVDDAAFFLKLYQSPDFVRYIGDRNFSSVTDVQQHLENGVIRQFIKLGFGYYLVRNKELEPIGTCGFMQKDYLQNLDFGFAFLPEFCRHGFGFEAGKAILDYGCTHFDITTVDAVTVPENLPSKFLLEKLGFEFQSEINEPGTDTLLQRYCYTHKKT
jgi:[ribosomal protein S5]-alanine N-acetyltransferase